MGKPSPPKPPDPVATAQAQTASNLATATGNAELNRTDMTTPWGAIKYTVNGTNPDGTPKYSGNLSLSPSEQQKFDLSQQGNIALGNTGQGMLGQVASAYSSPFSLSGAPGLQSSVGQSDFSKLPQMPTSVQQSDYSNAPGIQSNVNQNGGTTANAIQQAQDAAYKSQTQYLDPQYARAQPALENKLANQGITDTGSEAYKNAMNTFNEGKNQAYGAAQNSATMAGLQEQNTLFGQGLSSANLGNQAHQLGVSDLNNQFGQGLENANLAGQAHQQGASDLSQQFGQGQQNANLSNNARNQYLAQMIAQRNQPLNEYNALMTGNQVSQPVMPGTPGVNMAGTDVAGITNQGYQNQLGAYNAQQAGANNMLSGLFGLGGSALGAAGNAGSFASLFSDRRLKENIWRIGETPGGLGVYEYNFKGSDLLHVGVMADEVEAVIPEAVFIDPATGFKRVRYGMVK